MKLRIKIQAQCDKYLRQMAGEAKLSVEDLAEIAVYNLVACWLSDRNEPLNTHAPSVLSGKPDNGPISSL